MKNNRILLVFAATLTVFVTSAIAIAQPRGSRWSEQRVTRRVIARMEARLNITSDQRAQVKAILKAEEPTLVALAAQSKEERVAMAALPAYDEAAVRQVAQKYATTNTDILVERAKLRLELRAILTQEQLQKLEELKSKADGRLAEGSTRSLETFSFATIYHGSTDGQTGSQCCAFRKGQLRSLLRMY
jgi:Spy/CpxP family protein refolding chaperone